MGKCKSCLDEQLTKQASASFALIGFKLKEQQDALNSRT
jgi:hypothetical protein